jgi:hypothetical protein
VERAAVLHGPRGPPYPHPPVRADRLMRGARPAAAVLAALALGGWASSCGGRPPAPAAVAAECAPAAGPLAADARADALAGEHRLTLVAARGARTGESASGRLTLRAFGNRPVPVPAAAGTRYPLYGGTDVAVDAVGAVTPGAVAPDDAAAPGVLVMEWTRGDAPAGNRQITLRLGADANHGDLLRFDGAYLALTVTSVSADGFAGTWESGAGQAQAGGHFCAARTGGR